MTIPMELQHASEEFETFLVRARDVSGLATRNQTYTMVQAVLHVFRRRLALKAAIIFAGVLPPVLRAIFVADWNTDDVGVPFDDRPSMTREVQSIRGDHNFSPDTCIRDVATAMRAVVDVAAFDAVLASLPKGASAFWRVDDPRIG